MISASDHNLNLYTAVLPNATLQKMSVDLPITREEMLTVDGVTEYKFEVFDGFKFLDITTNYMALKASEFALNCPVCAYLTSTLIG